MSPFMEYPSKNEFAAKLRTESHENVVDQYLFRGTPFAFRTSHASYDFLVELLANNLGLSADSITMVGSGRIGFSLDPDRVGAPFSVRSDRTSLLLARECLTRHGSTCSVWVANIWRSRNACGEL